MPSLKCSFNFCELKTDRNNFFSFLKLYEKSYLLFPDGTMLAIGNRDNAIYVYEVSDDGKKYHRIGKCTVSGSHLICLEFANLDNVTDFIPLL